MHTLLVCNVIAQNTLNLRTTYCNNAKNVRLRLITQFKTASCRLQLLGYNFQFSMLNLKNLTPLTVLDKGAQVYYSCVASPTHRTMTK